MRAGCSILRLLRVVTRGGAAGLLFGIMLWVCGENPNYDHLHLLLQSLAEERVATVTGGWEYCHGRSRITRGLGRCGVGKGTVSQVLLLGILLAAIGSGTWQERAAMYGQYALDGIARS